MDEKIDSMMIAQQYSWRDILNTVLEGMNPWDIDIIELSQRYSQKVDEMLEMNFKLPANVVLVSSVLLRMKSDLLIPEEEKDPYAVKDHMMFLFDSNYPIAAILEGDDQDPYPIEAKPVRALTRRVSADELIDALQSVLREKERKPKTRKITDVDVNEDTKEVYVKNEMSIILLIEETYKKVLQILTKKEEVVLSDLARSTEEFISTFISLLHLSNSRKVNLRQDELYGEIYINTV